MNKKILLGLTTFLITINPIFAQETEENSSNKNNCLEKNGVIVCRGKTSLSNPGNSNFSVNQPVLNNIQANNPNNNNSNSSNNIIQSNQTTANQCIPDRVYGSDEFIRYTIGRTRINCLSPWHSDNTNNPAAENKNCFAAICAGFRGPNPADWIVLGPDGQTVDCRAGDYYRDSTGNLPAWWNNPQYCGSYSPRRIDTDPSVLSMYPISAYPPVNGNCAIEGWIILSYTANAVPYSNEDSTAIANRIQDCRGMYANEMTRNRLLSANAVRTGVSNPDGMSGSITNQQWFDRYTNTGTNNNTSCTTWDIAFNNCDYRSNKRFINYDSSNRDFIAGWDQIVMAARQNNVAGAAGVLLASGVKGLKDNNSTATVVTTNNTNINPGTLNNNFAQPPTPVSASLNNATINQTIDRNVNSGSRINNSNSNRQGLINIE